MFSSPTDENHQLGPEAVGKLSPLGKACHRDADAPPGELLFQPVTTLDQPPSTVTFLIISHFLYIKKTTKSWLIVSNPVHPIMIQ